MNNRNVMIGRALDLIMVGIPGRKCGKKHNNRWFDNYALYNFKRMKL